ncbi:hypothetical protein VTL71DRAFT_11384 [Oculimacula yallundae]|uniref:Uncharacterized protein n=1 Tax=Oculimacula yallundae TaxID=86028 RepID=A0ABR4CQ08_9HELO
MQRIHSSISQLPKVPIFRSSPLSSSSLTTKQFQSQKSKTKQKAKTKQPIPNPCLKSCLETATRNVPVRASSVKLLSYTEYYIHRGVVQVVKGTNPIKGSEDTSPPPELILDCLQSYTSQRLSISRSSIYGLPKNTSSPLLNKSLSSHCAKASSNFPIPIPMPILNRSGSRSRADISPTPELAAANASRNISSSCSEIFASPFR